MNQEYVLGMEVLQQRTIDFWMMFFEYGMQPKTYLIFHMNFDDDYV